MDVVIKHPRTQVEYRKVLFDGRNVYEVSMTSFNAVLAEVRTIIPALIEHETYTARDLCGESFWSRFPAGPSIAGRCVAHIAYHALLPLQFAGKTSGNHRLYMLDMDMFRREEWQSEVRAWTPFNARFQHEWRAQRCS